MRRSHSVYGMFALLMLAIPALAQEGRPANPSVPACDTALAVESCAPNARYRDAIEHAESLGMRLFRHDTAAWLTTDALRDAGAFESIPGRGAGWLTEDRDDGIRVGYFSEIDGQPAVFAEATLARESRQVLGAQRLAHPRPATVHQRQQLAARATAIATNPLRCTDAPFNTIILDADAGATPGIQVFLLSAMTDTSLPLGGFHRFRTSSDGARVIEHYAQTRGCLVGDAGKVNELAAMTVSHLTSPTPTEFHVFASLTYDKPVLVLTMENGLLWIVDRGAISELVEPDPRYEVGRQWRDEVMRANGDSGDSSTPSPP